MVTRRGVTTASGASTSAAVHRGEDARGYRRSTAARRPCHGDSRYLAAELRRLAATPTLTEVLQRIETRQGGRISLAEAADGIAEERNSRIVVDASVVANAVGDDQAAGRQARALPRQHVDVAARDLVDVETTAVLRPPLAQRHPRCRAIHPGARGSEGLADAALSYVAADAAGVSITGKSDGVRRVVRSLGRATRRTLVADDRRLSNAAGTACAICLVTASPPP